jgi:hypothetical protein
LEENFLKQLNFSDDVQRLLHAGIREVFSKENDLLGKENWRLADNKQELAFKSVDCLETIEYRSMKRYENTTVE